MAKIRTSHRRLAFWGGVYALTILGPISFNILADKLPFKGLRDLNDYATRRS